MLSEFGLLLYGIFLLEGGLWNSVFARRGLVVLDFWVFSFVFWVLLRCGFLFSGLFDFEGVCGLLGVGLMLPTGLVWCKVWTLGEFVGLQLFREIQVLDLWGIWRCICYFRVPVLCICLFWGDLVWWRMLLCRGFKFVVT